MILDFPSPVSTGTNFTAQNGVTYQYDGVKWTTVGSVASQGNTGTSWNLTSHGNGCPINVTLTTTTFDVQVPRNHLFFRDDGSWDIGSYVNGTYITGDTAGGNGIALTTDRGTVLFGNSPERTPITAASHFHIMKQDPTLVDLFFGDDFNNLKLPTTGGVSLQAFNTQTTINSTWTFGTDGVLTLPQVPPNYGNRNLSFIDAPADADLRLRTYGNGHASLRVISTISNSTRTLVDLDLDRVRISANNDEADVGGTKDWFFGADGSLLFPDTGLIDDNGGIFRVKSNANAVQLGSSDDQNYVTVTTSNVVIQTLADTSNYLWTFGTDGTTQFPNNALDAGTSTIAIKSTTIAELEYINDNFQNVANEVFDAFVGVDSDGPYMVNLAVNSGNTDSNLSTWSVDSKGNLVTSITHGISTSTDVGDIVDIDGNSIIYTIAGETPPTRAPAGRLWYNSVEGRMYIRYEDLWVDASPTVIPPPSTYLEGLRVGDTTISSVDSTGTVSIATGISNQWTFGLDGTLTLPAGYALPNTVGTAGQVLSISTNSNVLYWTTGFTDVLGVVTFPGDLLIGTLWPNGSDKESVVWAKDDTEYLGLWWGGDQTYPEAFYGPVAGIMIGIDGTDDFTHQTPSPVDTKITLAINGDMNTLKWVFDRDGGLTLPGLMTLPVTTSTPAITTATGTVAVCDGTGWNGGNDGLQHLMIYINNTWTKVI